MDTFFEQLVAIKKDYKTIFLFAVIWLFALLIIAFLLITFLLGGITILAVFGIGYGAFKLSSLLNVEYEYIITNGILDVDKIINKNSRKRLLSLDLRTVTRLEKHNSSITENINKKLLTFACNKDDENALFLLAETEGKSSSYLVFSPDERMRSAMQKYVPKFIGNSILK